MPYFGKESALIGSGLALRTSVRRGPATFRPDEPVEKMAKQMRERGASAVLVTTSEGRLLGLLYQDDAERLTAE